MLLLLILPLGGRICFTSVSDSLFCALPPSKFRPFGELCRSLEDLECSSFFSRSASDLVGVLKAFGKDSSSIVFGCTDLIGRESVRLRNEIPSRCRSFRFCKEQLSAKHSHYGLICQLTEGSSHGRSRVRPLTSTRLFISPPVLVFPVRFPDMTFFHSAL